MMTRLMFFLELDFPRNLKENMRQKYPKPLLISSPTYTLPPGGYLGQFLLCMYRWPLRAPYPIIVCSVTNYRPHLSHFGAKL